MVFKNQTTVLERDPRWDLKITRKPLLYWINKEFFLYSECMQSFKNGSLQEDAAAVITYCAMWKLVNEHGFPSLAELVSAANPRDPEERGGRGRHRGGDTTRTEGAASRYRRPAGAPTSPPGRRTEAKWPRGGGNVPAGGKELQLTGGRRAREPRLTLWALPAPPGPAAPQP